MLRESAVGPTDMMHQVCAAASGCHTGLLQHTSPPAGKGICFAAAAAAAGLNGDVATRYQFIDWSVVVVGVGGQKSRPQ